MAVTGHRAVRNVAIRRCNPLGPQHGRCGKRTYGAEWIASLFSLLLFWHQPRRDAEPYTLSMTCDNTQNLQLGLDCSEKVAEPGMWAQYDFGDGPEVNGAPTVLFCLWLAWCRFRVVIPILDRTSASVWAACDTAFRRLGGVPTYLLTDNEKTVTVEHVAGIPVRNPGAVEFGRHYGVTVATCVPYDPASKGGSESTVKLAKADLVPTDANLLPAYGSFAELEAACDGFCGLVNARPHRITRRAPAEMLAEEQARLHPVPARPLTAALGVTRRVDMTSLVTFEGGQYSVPHKLAGQAVHVRRHGEHVVITHAGADGARGVAGPLGAPPGSPRVDDAHSPPAPPGALTREPKARSAAEAEFLAIGNGAALWLGEAAAAGASRVRSKMAKAVQLAALHGAQAVDRALGQAAAAGRFADGDLASVIAHQALAVPGETSRAGEDRSLAQGPGGWAARDGKEAGR